MKIIIVAATGVLIFLCFRLFAILTNRYITARSQQVRIDRLLSISEVLIWLVFIFWALFYTLEEKTYFPYLLYSLVIVIVLLFSWFILKDILAGLVFRFQNHHTRGQMISFEGLTGKIINLGLMQLQIENKGSLIKVPYSKLSGQIISEATDTQTSQSAIDITIKKPVPVDTAIDRLRFILLNCPWFSPRSEPVIQLAKDLGQEYVFQLTVHSLDEHQRRLLEKYVRENTGLNVDP